MSSSIELSTADRPPSLAEVAYEAIRQAIVDKRFPPGHRMTETALAEQLGISKTPVREAMVRLRHVGVLEPAGNRKERVIVPSAERLREAFEVREVLEGFTAGAAAERGSDEQREAILDAARSSVKQASDADIKAFRRSDRAFHHAVAEAARNPQLARILDDALLLVGVIVERDVDVQTSIDGGRQHITIAEAIRHRDAEAARREMREHLQFARTVHLDAMTDAAARGDSGARASAAVQR